MNKIEIKFKNIKVRKNLILILKCTVNTKSLNDLQIDQYF